MILTVNSRVSLDFKALKRADEVCAMALVEAFTYTNPDFYKTRALGYSTRGMPTKCKTYERAGRMMNFGRGGIRKVKKILQRHGHKVKTVDQRLELPAVAFSWNKAVPLRPDQKEAAGVAIRKRQGLVRGSCSSGKSAILLGAIVEAKQPALVIVWDTNHQKQWIGEAEKFLGIKRADLGGCGGVFSKVKVRALNICMQQSLCRVDTLKAFVNAVGFVGADECQRYAARTFEAAINAFPAKYRIGVSANERRRDKKEFLIYDAFGKVIHEVSNANQESRKPSRIFLVPTKFKSHIFEDEGGSLGMLYSAFMEELTENEKRNRLILKMVRRSIEKKKLCLILTERRLHAMNLLFQLKKDFRCGLLIGNFPHKETADWPDDWRKFMTGFSAEKEFDRVQRLADERKIDVVVATQKGDVGLNFRTIDHVFVTTPTGANAERFNQQKGRGEREHSKEQIAQFGPKATPHVYYFWDTSMEKFQRAGNAIMRAFPGTTVFSQRKG